jgi:hypothetical protein
MSGEGITMSDGPRVQVIMSPEEKQRFESYCKARGFKKSTLIARLIREHLDQEKFQPQHELFRESTSTEKRGNR